jgi:hypothetical protein
MDIIFGTYTCPDHEPEKFGIKDSFPKNYFGQLMKPMLPGKRNQSIASKDLNPVEQ